MPWLTNQFVPRNLGYFFYLKFFFLPKNTATLFCECHYLKTSEERSSEFWTTSLEIKEKITAMTLATLKTIDPEFKTSQK